MSDQKKYPWNKSRQDDDGMMNDVYAGPEPREPEEDEPRPMEDVYAGPPMPEMMQCVYAGPEYFSGRQSSVGVRMPEQPEERLMFCPSCKQTVKKGSHYCSHCGAKLPEEAS